MSVAIPNFDPMIANKFVLSYENPIIRDFAKLLYLRDIEKISQSDPEFLHLQNTLLPYLQYGLTKWIEKNLRRRFLSIAEVMAYFGYLGLNGNKIPQLVKAIDITFSYYTRKDGAFRASSGKVNKCGNTAFLRAVLALGFTEHDQVQQACSEYLSYIKGQEGECHVRTDGNPCAYVLVKTLRWLNEYPTDWRNKEYHVVVKNIQDYLLSYNLSQADYPRRRPTPNKNWFKYGYFRSFQSSIFEATEALILSGIKKHPELIKALKIIGSHCINGATWKPQYVKSHWPLQLETKGKQRNQGSPWLTLRGLRITNFS